jgi:hypothetical protein
MAPAIYFNSLGTGYAFIPLAAQSYEMNTLGNMGYSSVQCQSIPVAVGKLSVSCPFGVIGEFYDYGINHSDDGGETDSCISTDNNSACKPNSSEFMQVLENAIGKQELTVEINSANIYDDTLSHDDCIDPNELP